MHGCTDPHAIFSCYAERAARYGESEAWGSAAAEMQGALTAWEIKSAEHAEPTPGAAEFMKAWAGAGRRLAVASNNHPDAIKRYLERESLSKYFVPSSVIGRNERDAVLMKPNPWALNEVMRDSAGGVTAHLMVGDSATDWQTANAVGCPSSGSTASPRSEWCCRGAERFPSPTRCRCSPMRRAGCRHKCGSTPGSCTFLVWIATSWPRRAAGPAAGARRP